MHASKLRSWSRVWFSQLTLLLLVLPAVRVGAPAGGLSASVGAPHEASPERPAPRRGSDATLVVLDPLLAERIESIGRDSPTFARAWQAVERSGFPVVLGTRSQLMELIPAPLRSSATWAGLTLGWADSQDRLERTAVIVELEWLRALHHSLGTGEPGFLAGLDALLIHEVYGHLVPLIESGSLAGACPDPDPGEWLLDSCVGRRERIIQSERAAHAARAAPPPVYSPPTRATASIICASTTCTATNSSGGEAR